MDIEFYQTTVFLKRIVQLVRECHQKILNIYNCDDFEIISKDDKSPVTEADRISNEHICHFLQQLRIDQSGIISEENKNDSYPRCK